MTCYKLTELQVGQAHHKVVSKHSVGCQFVRSLSLKLDISFVSLPTQNVNLKFLKPNLNFITTCLDWSKRIAVEDLVDPGVSSQLFGNL